MQSNRKSLALYLAVFFFATATWADGPDSQRLQSLAQGQYWRQLLHYSLGLFHGDQSEVDAPEFFTSSKGKFDPLAELQDNLSLFLDSHQKKVGLVPQDPQCAFPERYRYLKEQLHLKTRDSDCPEFKAWKKQMGAVVVSLVYASPYLGNPASMFGHTLLKLKSTANDLPVNDLLDSGVSFDAIPQNDSPIAYAFKGLTGGYPGIFSQQPYFSKIETYNNVESRDLWEYELSLTPVQIDQMLNHLWELGNARFDYYFLDENCSYHILALLEVANPQLDFRKKIKFFTIPIDTVRLISKIKNSVSQARYRPSVESTLHTRVEQMTESSRERFNQIRKGAPLGENENVETLDALLELQKFKRKSSEPGKPNLLEEKLLVLRSKQDTKSPIYTYSTLSPEKGHESSRVFLTRSMDARQELGVEIRPVLHDLLDSDIGYLPYSSLSIGQINFFSDLKSQKYGLSKFIIAEAIQLSPVNPFEKKISWIAAAKFLRPKDQECLDCLAGQIVLGAGASTLLTGQSWLLYSLIKGQLEESDIYRSISGDVFRGGPSVEVGTIAHLADHIKLSLAGEKYWYYPFDKFESFSTLEGQIALDLSPYQMRILSETTFLASRTLNTITFGVGWYF